MKRLPLSLVAALLTAAPAMATFELTDGASTIPVRIVNHTLLPKRGLRLKMAKYSDWLTVKVTGPGVTQVAKDRRGATYAIADIAEGKTLSLTLAVKIDKDTEIGSISNVFFTIWSEEENQGQTPQRKGKGKMGAPQWRSWRVDYGIRVVTEEVKREPDDIEWHLVEARRGSDKNEVNITIRNKSKFEPLTNIKVYGFSMNGLVKVGKRSVGKDAKVEGVPGLAVVKPGDSGRFSLNFSMSDRAQRGETDVLQLIVQTSTLGARPNPWNPAVFVTVAPPDIGLPGNFEAYVFYNLAPLGNPDKDVVDERTWLPVPKGTRMTVSQVYRMPGAGAATKYVEQFVGYGHIIDDRGYLRCRISPVNEPVLRLRLVAETMANRLDVKYKDDAKREVIEKFKVLPAWAAVTPQGKRLYRNISRTFRAVREKEASVIIRPARDDGRPASSKGKKVYFYRVLPDQPRAFVLGEGQGIKRILIPYYGFDNKVDPKRDKGIVINWEGELSTGGYINFFGSDTASTLQHMTGEAALMDNEQIIAGGNLGFIYHNHNELLHALAALVRAQEFLSKLNYFDTTLATIGRADRPAAKRKRQRGVIAYWRPRLDLSPGETGYGLWKGGKYRLMIQGKKDDPDERDTGLILRGFGAAVRRHFFRRDETDDEAAPKHQTYPYYKRTSVKQAWEQGFDIFFAACVLNSSAVRNNVAAEEKAKASRSVDLEEILRLAHESRGRIDEDQYGRVRGADNSVAVAAGLWRAAQAWSREGLLSSILWEEGGDLGWFMNTVAGRAPDVLKDLTALGLCPRIERWPPAAAAQERVSPAAVRIMFHPNGMTAAGEVKAAVVFGPPNGGAPVRFALGGKKGAKKPVVFDFGKLRNQAEGNAQLMAGWSNNQRYLWTIETQLDKGIIFQWPMQDFLAAVPTVDLSQRGAHVPLARPGTAPGASVDFPSGALDGDVTTETFTIGSVLGGRKVLGGAVYRIAAKNGDMNVAFLKPATLTLGWRDFEDPGDATPGIYRLNADTGAWEIVGDTRVGKRQVKAAITRTGSYALCVDAFPPGLSDVEAAPNPFPSKLDGVVWKLRMRLSEPAQVTATVANDAGKIVRTLLDKAAKSAGEVEIAWDGKGARDGRYTYRVVAVDDSGRACEPLTGEVTVFNGDMGSAAGEVKLATGAAATPRVAARGTSLSSDCDPDGAYWLIGLAPGKHVIRFSCPGHFSETRECETTTGQPDVELAPVTLTNRAIEKLRVAPECFTPDGDGERDYAAIRFTATRACPMDVLVQDARGATVAALAEKKPLSAGEQVFVWQGMNDEREKLPSGWYDVRVVGHSDTEAIPQGSVKVLLDNGLIQTAHAFPFTFSPNNDGFDDELEIGYQLESDGLVTAAILDAKGAELLKIATNAKQAAGWNVIRWDGRGRDGKIMSDGRYQFELRPSYPSGHASLVVRGDFMLDSVAPTLADVAPVNGSTIDTGMPTIQARVVGSDGDVDRSQLKIKIDENTVLADSYDAASGVFSFTPKTSLGEGLHIAIAYAQDWAGNYAPPQAVSFKVKLGKDDKFVDREKPAISDLRPDKGQTVYSATPLLTAKLRDAESGIDDKTITIYVNGERVANAVQYFLPGKSGKAWDWYSYAKAIVLYDPLQGDVRYVPLEPLPEGKNHFALEVYDRAGNKSAKADAVFTVVVDKEPPTVRIEQPLNEAIRAKTDVVVKAKLADSGKAGIDIATLRVVVDGVAQTIADPALHYDGKTQTLTFPLPQPLSRDAQHSVTVAVRDRAGNVSRPATSIFSIVADSDAPRIDVLSPSATVAAGKPVPLVAAIYDLGRSGIDASSIALKLDGKPIGVDDPNTVDIEGYLYSSGALRYTFAPLAAGTHVLSISARDRAGNPAKDVVLEVVAE